MSYKTTKDGTNIKQRLGELKDSLARNPSTRLIESGMLPTIVEDVDMVSDPFSYQSKLMTNAEDKINMIPKGVREVGKQLYMTNDTTTYKLMSQATQFSDYAARYTLYQHVTGRKENTLGHDEAMDLVMDAFVNYDIPTHKSVQYLNDMGVLRFSKYYIRIQRIIAGLIKEKPVRGLAVLAANNYLTDLPSIMDSSVINQYGNPIQGSVMDYTDSLGGIAPISLLTGFFK